MTLQETATETTGKMRSYPIHPLKIVLFYKIENNDVVEVNLIPKHQLDRIKFFHM